LRTHAGVFALSAAMLIVMAGCGPSHGPSHALPGIVADSPTAPSKSATVIPVVACRTSSGQLGAPKPYYPAAAVIGVAAEINPPFRSCSSRPARETVIWSAGSPAVTSSGYDAIGFADPPGVKGDGALSGGAYAARGVVLFAWAGPLRWRASDITCTLPAPDADLCTAILSAFRQQRWLLPGFAGSPSHVSISIGKTLSYDEGDTGNCTWWAIHEFQLYSGLYPNFSDPANSGDAKFWATNAAYNGWTVSSTPRVDSIAVFPPNANEAGSFGHVGWVTAVSGSQITISEMNFGENALGKVDSRAMTPDNSVRYILAP